MTKEIIGQIFGMIAVVLGFLIYQVKSKKQILIVQIITSAVFCVHYSLLGATSGFVLNAIGFVRSIIYYNSDKKIFSGKYIPWLFSVLMAFAGMIFWESWYSVFVVVGITINSFALSFKNPQNLRKSILITSPLVLIYDILCHAIGGSIYEAIAIISALTGLIRFKKSKTDKIK